MIAPQTKSSEIMDKLTPSLINEDDLLDEHTLRRLLRDVESIPVADERLALKGIILILLGKVDEGSVFCDRAIQIDPTQLANWGNYVTVLNTYGHSSKRREVMYRAIDNVHKCPALFPILTNYTLVSFDYEMLVMLIDKADKMLVDITQNLHPSEAFKFNSLLKNPGKAKEFSKLSCETLDFLDKKKISRVGTALCIDLDDIWGFICAIKGVNLDIVSDLNDELFEYLYNKSVDMSGMYAFFEVAEYNEHREC